MIAGHEAMVCGVHLEAKKLFPWFPTCHVGLKFMGLPTYVLSHRSEVSQSTKHVSGPGTPHSTCTSTWHISEGLVLGEGKPKILSDR